MWKNGLYFTKRKTTGIANSYVQFNTLSFNISFRTRSLKVPFLINVSNWKFVCFFNFSSSFLLSHLSHCLSVHSPPTFTHQYKTCSYLLCDFIHPLLLILSSDQISPSALGVAQYFRVLFCGTQTQTHTIEHNSL